jgi:hypothetical protein
MWYGVALFDGETLNSSPAGHQIRLTKMARLVKMTDFVRIDKFGIVN